MCGWNIVSFCIWVKFVKMGVATVFLPSINCVHVGTHVSGGQIWTSNVSYIVLYLVF